MVWSDHPIEKLQISKPHPCAQSFKSILCPYRYCYPIPSFIKTIPLISLHWSRFGSSYHGTVGLLQLWYRQMWLGFNPWPRNFHMPRCSRKRKKKKKISFGVLLWHSRLRIRCCYCNSLGRCCGLSSVPGLGTSTCHQHSQNFYVFIYLFIYFLLGKKKKIFITQMNLSHL